ncbi:hypothetical protein KI387_006372, partial [Taxus chinensis]
RLQNIVESVDVRVDELKKHKVTTQVSDHSEESDQNEVEEEIEEEERKETKAPSRFVQKDHGEILILNDKDDGV